MSIPWLAVLLTMTAPQELYHEHNVYDVRQNGAAVGTHQIDFRGDWQMLTVIIRTRATLSLFGVVPIPFNYDSQAVWQHGDLQQITASYRRGWVRGQAMTKRQGDVYLVNGRAIAAPLLPTNHWYGAVLTQTAVFNTLNNRVSRVRITAAAEDQIIINDQQHRATRYEYRGDIDADSWYDQNGRWLKLSFTSWGGDYEFICRRCGP